MGTYQPRHDRQPNLRSQTQDSPLPELPAYADNTVQSAPTNTTATTSSSGLLTTTVSTPARMVVSGVPAQREMDNEERNRRAASVLSMDDLEAAQALEGLRSGQFAAVNTSSNKKYLILTLCSDFE